MANNYRQGSCKLSLAPEQIAQAALIVERVTTELNDSDESYCGVHVCMESDGVWFSGDEHLEVEHVVFIVQALLDELEIDEPFTFSLADTCSKLRLDEFGGGAVSVKRGEDPFYVDAFDLAAAYFTTPTPSLTRYAPLSDAG